MISSASHSVHLLIHCVHLRLIPFLCAVTGRPSQRQASRMTEPAVIHLTSNEGTIKLLKTMQERLVIEQGSTTGDTFEGVIQELSPSYNPFYCVLYNHGIISLSRSLFLSVLFWGQRLIVHLSPTYIYN
jgi:hypothetical protein